jgi:hypothetical protein
MTLPSPISFLLFSLRVLQVNERDITNITLRAFVQARSHFQGQAGRSLSSLLSIPQLHATGYRQLSLLYPTPSLSSIWLEPPEKMVTFPNKDDIIMT